MLKADDKPSWWRPLWLAVLLITTGLGAANYFLFKVPLERVLGGLALTFLMIVIAYYIRIKPSRKVNRLIYVTLGACGAFLITLFGGAFIIWATGCPPPTTYLGPSVSFILFLIAPWIVGAYIGDWIGKRRRYRIPLSLEG
jgi:VIT1/CCC1 family predicted Fe2+/Mn2+ transporter